MVYNPELIVKDYIMNRTIFPSGIKYWYKIAEHKTSYNLFIKAKRCNAPPKFNSDELLMMVALQNKFKVLLQQGLSVHNRKVW